MAQVATEQSLDKDRARWVLDGLLALSFLTWFAYVLWHTYLAFWQRLGDPGQLEGLARLLTETAPGKALLLLGLCYALLVLVLVAWGYLPRARRLASIPLLYPLLVILLAAAYAVAGVPRREEITRELVAFLILALVAYSCGRLLTSRLLPGLHRGLETFTLSSAFGLGALAIGSGVLAHLGILYDWAIYALLLICFGVSLSSVGRELLHGLSRLQVQFEAMLDQSLLWKIAVPAIVLQGLTLLLFALLPETGSDALSQHLFYSRVFLESNGWVNRYAEDYHFGLPMGYNALYAIALALSDEVGAKLVQWWCGVLSLAGAFLLGRRLFGASAGILAAMILINVPIFAWEMQTAYVDMVFALFSSLAIYAMMRWYAGYERRWLWAAALLTGLALYGKLQAVYVILLLLVGTAVGVLLQRTRLDRRSLLGNIAAPAVLAGTLGSLWYVRNWLAAGNPVMPFFNSIFQSPYYPPVNTVFDRDNFGVGEGLVSQYLLMPWNMVTLPEAFGGVIGPALLLFVPTLLAVRKPTKGVLLLALLAGVYGIAMALTVPIARYMLVILPASAVLAAHGVCQGISRLEKPWRQIAVASTAVAFSTMYVLNLPLFADYRHGVWVPHALHAGDLVLAAIADDEARDKYMAERLPTYGAQKWAASNLPASAKVAVYGESLNYYLGARAVAVKDVIFGQDLLSRDRQTLLQALRGLGATHVLVPGSAIASIRGSGLRLDSEFANRHLETLQVLDGNWVFAVNYDAPPGNHPWTVVKDIVCDFESVGPASDTGKQGSVWLRTFEQADESRYGIQEVAPARFEYAVKLPVAKTVQLFFGLAALSVDFGDGVLARLEVVQGGTTKEVYRRYINTHSNPQSDRRWFDEVVDLTAFSGQEVALRFVADTGLEPNSDGSGDWLLWSRPLIAAEQ